MRGGLAVFIGTKAQYIKTAPLIRLLDERGVAYRLIDSGQHARIAVGMRDDLGVRDPDYALGGSRDVASIPQAIAWSARIAARLWSGRRIREEIFGGTPGICVVHGDTPSTLLSTLMARRAGLRVAHLEAGLRSHKLTHPFPEEMIRVVVMHLAHILFAPDAVAVDNLRRMRVRGRIVPLSGNTSLEAVRFALGGEVGAAAGPVTVTMHRVENLHHARRVEGFVDLVLRIAKEQTVRFVVHDPTEVVLRRTGAGERLRAVGVEMLPLRPHPEFVAMLRLAPFVVTDGGSIQEECALLGVPTLLWRDRSERPDGLDANVVLAHYDPGVVDDFLTDPERWRRAPLAPPASPSEQILEVLLDELRT